MEVGADTPTFPGRGGNPGGLLSVWFADFRTEGGGLDKGRLQIDDEELIA